MITDTAFDGSSVVVSESDVTNAPSTQSLPFPKKRISGHFAGFHLCLPGRVVLA